VVAHARTHPRRPHRQAPLGVRLFSYLNTDPADPRNIAEYGGGALLDIGCYPVKTSRFVFGDEPERVFACIERDPSFKTDRLTSAILEFPTGQCIFTSSTQLVAYQKMQFFGTEGRIDIEIPFNAPTDKPARIFIDNGKELYADGSAITESFPVCNQYTIQGDLFSQAIRENKEVPIPWKMPSATWRSLTRSSAPPNPATGKFPSLSNLYPMPFARIGLP